MSTETFEPNEINVDIHINPSDELQILQVALGLGGPVAVLDLDPSTTYESMTIRVRAGGLGSAENTPVEGLRDFLSLVLKAIPAAVSPQKTTTTVSVISTDDELTDWIRTADNPDYFAIDADQERHVIHFTDDEVYATRPTNENDQHPDGTYPTGGVTTPLDTLPLPITIIEAHS